MKKREQAYLNFDKISTVGSSKNFNLLVEIKGDKSLVVDGGLSMVNRGEEGLFMELGTFLFLMESERRNFSMKSKKEEGTFQSRIFLSFLFLLLI